MKDIEKLYYNFDKLHDNYVSMPETLKIGEELEAYIKESVPAEKRIPMSDMVAAANAENEKQGFIYGFQYAISLLTCGNATDN